MMWYRRVSQLVLAVTAFVILIAAGMVVTAFIDDATLNSNKATATAEVVSTSRFSTSVRFRDQNEVYYQPKTGLKYPTGLEAGQKVRVEYQVDNPHNVRVEGRTWVLSLIPALSTILLAVMFGGGVVWCMRVWHNKRVVYEKFT